MIVIFGSGIIGLFIAHKLLSEGEDVKILDQKKQTGNATDASVGMLAPLLEAKPHEEKLFNLMQNSKLIWDELKKNNTVTNEIGLRDNSSLLIATHEDEVNSLIFKKKFIEKLGVAPKILDSKETLKIEPNLNSNIKCSLFLQNNNQVSPPLLKKFLTNQIIQMGGEILVEEKIDKFSFSKNQLLVSNKKIKAKKIIVACGVWSNELLKNSLGIEFPMRPIKGVSMLFETEHQLFKNNVWFKNLYIAPRKKNELAVGATEEEKSFEKVVTLDEIFYLSRKLWEYLPEIEKLKFKNIFCGLRSTVIDGSPIIGYLKSNSDIICSFGHFRNGILLGPVTAEIVTNYILEKEINNDQMFFSPNRFNL